MQKLGITSYELVALQDDESKPLYKTINPHTCCLNAAYSAVTRQYRLTSERTKYMTCDEPESLFADDLDLDKSLHDLYKGLKNVDDTGYTLDNDLVRLLPKGFAFMNIRLECRFKQKHFLFSSVFEQPAKEQLFLAFLRS